MAKVMIVDDSLFMRKHIAKMLDKYGYETVGAADGEQAVDTYREAHPDAVLMDITMPRMDGLEALAEICQLDPQARVIMLTALGQTMAATRAMHIGAKDFLVKPVPPNELIGALQKALE